MSLQPPRSTQDANSFLQNIATNVPYQTAGLPNLLCGVGNSAKFGLHVDNKKFNTQNN
jgi:hypothetical protein